MSSEIGGPSALTGLSWPTLCCSGRPRSTTSMETTLGLSLTWALISARSTLSAPSTLTLPSAPRVNVAWPEAVACRSSLSIRRNFLKFSFRFEPPPRSRLMVPEPSIVPVFSSLAVRLCRVIWPRSRAALACRLVSTRPEA